MKMNKAVFLDRDGVLIEERGDYTWNLEDMKINQDVVEGLKILQEAGYILIVISNQAGIAKGLYTTEQADFLHFHLIRFLSMKGVQLTDVYYCPHHPTVGNCLCRKPDSLLLEKALARYDLNPTESWFVGDADRDIEAGKKAGVKVLKIEPNGSMLKAARLILSEAS